MYNVCSVHRRVFVVSGEYHESIGEVFSTPGSEFTTISPAKLERCQQQFLRNASYIPKFALKQLLLKWSGLK